MAMRIDGDYDSQVGPVVRVMIRPCEPDGHGVVLTEAEAVLKGNEPRTMIGTRLAEMMGVSLPQRQPSGDTSVDILFRDEAGGLAVFNGVGVTIERNLPFPLPDGVWMVMGRDVIECGNLFLQEEDGTYRFTFHVDTGTGIKALLHRPA